MARASWRRGSPIDKFTSGYRPHRMDPSAIRSWTEARLKSKSASAVKAWLSEKSRETDEGLRALTQLPSNEKVKKALANAREHKAWLALVRREVERCRPRQTRMR